MLCPVCGGNMSENNQYCCLACYNKANGMKEEVIEDENTKLVRRDRWE